MKIRLEQSEDAMDADFEIKVKFYKEKTDKNFDLRMWRLTEDKDHHNFIGWVLFNLSKGNMISAEAFEPDEVNNIQEKIKNMDKQRLIANKMICGLTFLFGFILAVIPMSDSPNYPTLWFEIGGSIVSGLSIIAYILIKTEKKE